MQKFRGINDAKISQKVRKFSEKMEIMAKKN